MILDADMNPLFYAKCRRYAYDNIDLPLILSTQYYIATGVEFSGLAGSFLGEINPKLPRLGSERKYRIYDVKNELRGKAFEKSVKPAPFLKLTNSENEIIASIEGFSKSFGREPRIFIMTLDNKEIIATCTAIAQNSYKMKILLQEINQFLILSFATLYLLKPRIW